MLTGHASLTAAIAAINKGEIYRFFLKPWDIPNWSLRCRLRSKNIIWKPKTGDFWRIIRRRRST